MQNTIKLEDGRVFNMKLWNEFFDDEVEKLITEVGNEQLPKTKFKDAIKLFKNLIEKEEFEEFLTLPAYKYL